jgi:hypothetical protein
MAEMLEKEFKSQPLKMFNDLKEDPNTQLIDVKKSIQDQVRKSEE